MNIHIIHPEGNVSNNPHLNSLCLLMAEAGHQLTIWSPHRDIPQATPSPSITLRLLGSYANHGMFLFPDNLSEHAQKELLHSFCGVDVVLGVDRGIIEAAFVAKTHNAVLGLMSYEIFFESEAGIEFKKPEVDACQQLDFLIIQDQLREKNCRQENQIPHHVKSFYMPVAGADLVLPEKYKNRHLRQIFGIPEDHKVALFMGSVESWSGVFELVSAVLKWPASWHLVLQNRYGSNTILSGIKEVTTNFPQIHISDYCFETHTEMAPWLHEADCGIAFYKPTYDGIHTGRNLADLGMASGKISTYLQHGLPVVTNRIGILADLVVKTQSGIVVDDMTSFIIPDNIKDKSSNAQLCFSEFLDCRKTAIQFLDYLRRLMTPIHQLNISSGSYCAPAAPEQIPVKEALTDFNLSAKTFLFFQFSRTYHLPLLDKFALELYGQQVNWSLCDLKVYQDLLVFAYIRLNLKAGSKILEIGGGNSRLLAALQNEYECWNIDKFEGVGAGPTSVCDTGYKLVRDYIGEFNTELPDNYFDFVFSISVLEHVTSEQHGLEKIYQDIMRVLKPNSQTLHCIDIVIKPDDVWVHPIVEYLINSENLPQIYKNNLKNDYQRYVMSEEAYNYYWRSVCCKDYKDFGEPLSYNLLWVKSDNNVSLKHENPIISVIVTTYASEAFMRECLDDLVNQTVFNQIEVVIVDAASPENEHSIIEQYQQHHNNIRYIRTPERITVYAAWNLAIKEARGTYITTFSTNDRLAPNACEVLKTALEQNPDAALVYGDTYLTATPHETFDNHTLIGTYEWADYSFISLLTTCLVGPHPMWRKAVHDTIGYFDDKYLALGDQEFWLRMGEQFKLLHIKVFTGLYWVDDNALSQREANEINSIRTIYQNRHAALLHAFTPPKVSIVIPLYNQVNFTANCLEKLFMHTFASQYELILVDNGSTDRTEELLAVLPSTVKIIRNKENLGFAKASNQGAAAAKGKYLLFLNNDTEPLEDWLKPLVKILDTDPAVAAVGSKLLYADNTLQHAGVLVFNHYSTKNLLRLNHIYMGEPSDLPSANIACHYQVITGACLMVRKEAFEAVGGFDEQYWNGFEDVELCFKLGQAGWKLVYEPKSVLYHFESKSGPERFVKEAENTNLLRSRWQGLIKPDLVIHEGDSSTCISGFPCEYKRKG